MGTSRKRRLPLKKGSIYLTFVRQYRFLCRGPDANFEGNRVMRDYYELLGVAPDANADAIKLAYKKKAAQYHPDRNPAPYASARFQEVQKAYNVLSDVGQRKDYDDTRRRSLLSDPLDTAREIFGAFLKGVRQDAEV
jgi:curved DNA-binding protein CbpA